MRQPTFLLTALLVAVLLACACGGGGDRPLVRIQSSGTAAPPRAGDTARPAAPASDGRPLVFLDPGHGGSDGWGTAYQLAGALPRKT
jgi:N-acetylmuramoyl-L-alanine amidase